LIFEAPRHIKPLLQHPADMAASKLLLLTLLCSMLGELSSDLVAFQDVLRRRGQGSECFFLAASCRGACAEPDSDTEAVVGKGFKLGCISCKKRSEVEGTATVEWHFRGKGEEDFYHVSVQIIRPGGDS